MEKMIVIYITCNSSEEAEKIGKLLMKKRLAPCYNIISNMKSACFWPPKTGKIEEINGIILLVKTLEEKFDAIEKEVESIHSDDVPCIFALPVTRVSKKYLAWLEKEIHSFKN
jgi:periplasmic divalent cation tolerance protein